MKTTQATYTILTKIHEGLAYKGLAIIINEAFKNADRDTITRLVKDIKTMSFLDVNLDEVDINVILAYAKGEVKFEDITVGEPEAEEEPINIAVKYEIVHQITSMLRVRKLETVRRFIASLSKQEKAYGNKVFEETYPLYFKD